MENNYFSINIVWGPGVQKTNHYEATKWENGRIYEEPDALCTESAVENKKEMDWPKY